MIAATLHPNYFYHFRHWLIEDIPSEQVEDVVYF